MRPFPGATFWVRQSRWLSLIVRPTNEPLAMQDDQPVLDRLLHDILAVVGSSSQMAVLSMSDSDCTIQLGRSEDAIISITLCDPSRPTFSITYPALTFRRDGSESIGEQASDGILADGVAWIARKVFRFGFVPPDGYASPQSNRGATLIHSET